MDKIYIGRMCLTKINQNRIFESPDTGQQWIDVSLIVLEKPDKFGNEIIIQHKGKNAREHVIIGNAVLRGLLHFIFPSARTVPSKMEYEVETESMERKY